MNVFKLECLKLVNDNYYVKDSYVSSIYEIEIIDLDSLKRRVRENYVKYTATNNVSHIEINDTIFNENDKNINKVIKNEIAKHIGEYCKIIESGQKVYIDKKFMNEYLYSKYSCGLREKKKYIKASLINEIDKLIENATDRTWNKNIKEKHKKDAYYGFYKYSAIFSYRRIRYSCIILIRNSMNGKKYLYDILDIKKLIKRYQ